MSLDPCLSGGLVESDDVLRVALQELEMERAGGSIGATSTSAGARSHRQRMMTSSRDGPAARKPVVLRVFEAETSLREMDVCLDDLFPQENTAAKRDTHHQKMMTSPMQLDVCLDDLFPQENTAAKPDTDEFAFSDLGADEAQGDDFSFT